MEGNYRLKAKVGQHEFDAEGPAEVVKEQFQLWKDMIATTPPTSLPLAQIEERRDEFPSTMGSSKTLDSASVDAALGKIMTVNDRVVSLTIRAESLESAILLILLGQKIIRGNESVTGGDIMSGLVSTGGSSVGRIDRVLEKIGRDGDLIITGERRSKRYRMTNAGLAKARQIASNLIAIVP